MSKILLAEDDRVLNHAIASWLRSMGAEVKAVFDGHHAFDNYVIDKYDLIITDFKMPNVDGAHLAAKVFKCDPRQKLLMITASNVGEVKPVLLKHGLTLESFPILMKPFGMRNLSESLRTLGVFP